MLQKLKGVGLDAKYLALAFYTTILSVGLMSLCLSLFVTIKGGTDLEVVAGPAVIMLIGGLFLAVAAWPVTLPASVVGWILGFRIGQVIFASRYAASIFAAGSAGIASSIVFGFWISPRGLPVHSGSLEVAIFLIAPFVVLASIIVASRIYKSEALS